MTTDASLVEAARTGDQAAFEELYRRYFDPLYDFAVRSMKDRDAAADVVQDAFIKANGRLDQLRDPAAFRPWMYRIVRNETIAHFRSHKREESVATIDDADAARLNPLLMIESDDPRSDPVVAAELQDSADLVWEAAASLDADTYTVLDLHVRQGLSSAEIADVLDITKGSAYTRLNRTKERAAGAIGTYLLIRKGVRSCEELQAVVANHELPPVREELRRAVDRHVKTCDECDRTRRALVAPMQLFAAMAAIPPPEGLQAAIWERVSSTRRGGTRRRTVLVAAATVLIIAVIGLGTGLIVGNVLRSDDPAAAEASGSGSSTPPGTPLIVDDASSPVDADPSSDASGDTTTEPPSDGSSAGGGEGTQPPPAPTNTTAPPTTQAPTTVTTPPDTDPPVLANAAADPTEIYELDSETLSCPPGTARTATISVFVTDANSGVSSVTASWTTAAGAESVAMTGSGGTYEAEFGPFTYLTAPDNGEVDVTIVITAVDADGNEAKTSLVVRLHSLAKCFG